MFQVVSSNKRCYKYKTRAKENLHLSLDIWGKIMTKDEEKTEVLNVFFPSVFNSKTSCSVGTQTPEPEDKDREMVSDVLHYLGRHKSMQPDGIQKRIVQELAEGLPEPLSIIYQQCQITQEVPGDWKLGNGTPIYKMGWKEDRGTARKEDPCLTKSFLCPPSLLL